MIPVGDSVLFLLAYLVALLILGVLVVVTAMGVDR